MTFDELKEVFHWYRQGKETKYSLILAIKKWQHETYGEKDESNNSGNSSR